MWCGIAYFQPRTKWQTGRLYYGRMSTGMVIDAR